VCDDIAVRQILRQMDKCQNRHQGCPHRNIPLLPKRVIDVGSEILSSIARLHISEKDEKASYAAPSYCWGGSYNVTTARDNLQARIEGVEIARLPQTMQDAIQITKKLGIRYLWIDSLCIVQDSIADKVHEINYMGLIYKSSTLTIAAANARTVHDGFISAVPMRGCDCLPFLLPDGHFGKIRTIATVRQGDTRWPLDLRAWPLQEFLLSPRVLAFGDGELRWQCQTEDLKALSASHVEYNLTLNRLPDRVFTGYLAHLIDISVEQEHVWRSLIKDYSRRQITFPEDRLPAIAGIACELSKVWQDKYLAGMWKRCLIQHLGWSSTCPIRLYKVALTLEIHFGKPPPPPLVRPVQAPSWSWVSVNRAIDLTYAPIADAEVVHCQVELVDEDSPFRQVSSGELTLRAANIKVTDLSVRDLAEFKSHIAYENEESLDNTSVLVLLGRKESWNSSFRHRSSASVHLKRQVQTNWPILMLTSYR
jgi:hypothetical protein